MQRDQSSSIEVAEVEPELLPQLRTIWRHRRLVAAVTVLAAIVATVLTVALVPTSFEASSMAQVGASYSLGSLDFYRSLFLSPGVLGDAAVKAASASGRSDVRVEVDREAGTLRLVARAASTEAAKRLGDTWYQAFLSAVPRMLTERVDAEVRLEQARIEGMRRELSDGYYPDSVRREAKSSSRDLESGTRDEKPASRGEAYAAYMLAVGDLERVRRVKQELLEKRIVDLHQLTPFESTGQPVAPRTLFNAIAAGFAGLLLSSVFAVSYDGLRALSERQSKRARSI